MLKRDFYTHKTLWVAKNLLGKVLVRQMGKKKIRGIITETEAYCGPSDKASHAWRGRTARTEIMFGPPGYAYVYLIYGMHFCLNVVTERKGYPAAVLIRAALIEGKKPHETHGPAKLCRALNITKSLNGQDLTKKTCLWIEDASLPIQKSKIVSLPRVGVDYAQDYRDKKWRFLLTTLTEECLRVVRHGGETLILLEKTPIV